MAYLQSAVTGKAKTKIAWMLADGRYYEHAYDVLRRHFGRHEQVAKAYLKKLSNLKLDKTKGVDLSERLSQYAADLHITVITLRDYGCKADLEATSNLDNVFSELPRFLIEKWTKYELSQSPTKLDL